MKKLLLLALLCVSSLLAFAQGDIQFTLLQTSQADVPQGVIDALDLKLKQVLTRNSAASANAYNVFTIEPALELTDVQTSEGLMQNVSVARGELVLMVKNRVDETLYYSMTIPVKGNGVGDKEKAMKAMVADIKVTNNAFTRFIRISRQKIQDYYAANCAIILQKAQGLCDQKKYLEAISYLSAISEAVPCYEQASVLMAELAQYMPDAPDTVIVQRVVEKPVETIVEKVVEKPVVVEKIVEKPVIVEKVVEKPVIVEKETSKADCEITISTNNLQFKVLKCTGNSVQQRITIQAELTNMDTNRNTNEYLGFISAYTNSGVECKSFDWPEGHAKRLPPRVPVRCEFYVTKVFDRFPLFSYIELEVGNARVYIRNLPVQW